MDRKVLNVEILESTEKTLQASAEAVGTTMGDIIDRMALNWEVNDPIYAAQLVLEEMAIHFRRLSQEDINSALIVILNVIKRCMEDDLTPENIKKAAAEYFVCDSEVEA